MRCRLCVPYAFLLAAFLQSSLASGASLAIQRAEVERVEDGHPIFPPDSFAAGETLHFSFYVEGYTRKEKNTETEKEKEVRLSFEAKPVDAAGAPLAPVVSSTLAEILTPQDKHWQPKLRGSFHLPDVLSGGSYRILLSVKDELSGESVKGELLFRVAGPKIDTSKELQIRNLNFYRTEEDERPLDVAAFRLSEEIHARFHITGFSRDQQGVSDVVYGIAITDPSGHVVFAEPSAAEDKSDDFYPKPFIPGLVTFSLKAGTPAGEYFLTVTAADKATGDDRKAEVRRSFRLE